MSASRRVLLEEECTSCAQTKGNLHYRWCDEPGKCGGPLDGWGLTAEDIELALMELNLAVSRAKR